MTHPTGEPTVQISLGGKRFDPRAEQEAQELDSNNVPEDPSAVAAWIVQFTRPLSDAESRELRATHGLALNEYLPPRSYVEPVSYTHLDVYKRQVPSRQRGSVG